jgi:RNA polymerase sigma-70 factor (ECF subfamily)
MPMSGEPHGGAAAPDPEERDLLRSLREGEHAGLARLIERHGEGLMQYLHSILRNREDAEEAFQDTWIRVVEKAHRCDPDRPFAPWLFRIARNRAYDHLRQRRRWSLFSLEGPGLRPRPDPGSDPDAALERMVARDLAARLLPLLEPASREVICLRFYREHSYEEIAEICGVPVGTVKSRLRRALDRLGQLLERMETHEDEHAGR